MSGIIVPVGTGPIAPGPGPPPPPSPGSITDGSYTLCDMRDQVRAVMRDEDGDFIKDGEIDKWLNYALGQLAWREKCVKREQDGNLASGVSSLPVPQYFLEKESLTIMLPPSMVTTVESSDTVEFVDDRTWTFYQNQRLPSPPHFIARLWGANIEFFPVLTGATTYILRFFSRPIPLVDCNDVSEVPFELQSKAIAYAMWQGKLKEREFDTAQAYQAEWMGELPKGDVQGRFDPGPLTMTPDLSSAWDTDPEAMHI